MEKIFRNTDTSLYDRKIRERQNVNQLNFRRSVFSGTSQPKIKNFKRGWL